MYKNYIACSEVVALNVYHSGQILTQFPGVELANFSMLIFDTMHTAGVCLKGHSVEVWGVQHLPSVLGATNINIDHIIRSTSTFNDIL